MATIPPPEGVEPVMPDATPKAPSPLSFPDFRYFWLARFTAVMATIAMVVVIGYQLYDTARSDYGMSIKEASFQLGLLGLFQFVPLAVLTPVAGWAADRFERRTRRDLLEPHRPGHRRDARLVHLDRRADALAAVRPRRAPRRRARFFRPGDERDRAQYRPARGAAARHRDEQHRLAIGIGDRPRRGRADLCRASRGRLCLRRHPARYLRLHAQPRAPGAAAARRSAPPSAARDGRRAAIRLGRTLPAGHDHARPVRGAARRGDRDVPGLRARHIGRRPRRRRVDARRRRLRLGRRRGRPGDPSDRARRRGQDAVGGRRLRRHHHRLWLFDQSRSYRSSCSS